MTERSGTTGVFTDTGPFTIIPEWLLDEEISDRAVRLYAVLGRYADKAGRSWPSRKRLAERLGCSVNSLDRARAELEEIGALVTEQRYTDEGVPTTNLYVLRRGIPTDAGRGIPVAGETDTPTAGEGNDNQGEREPSERETHGELALAYDPMKGKQIGGRNLPWDALVEETGADERAEKGRIARSLKTIRRICAADYNLDANAELGESFIASEIRVRARLYRERWPDVELTPSALAANWSRVTTRRPGASLDSTLEAVQRGIDSARRTT